MPQLTCGDSSPAQETPLLCRGKHALLVRFRIPLAPDGKFEPNPMSTLLLLRSILMRAKITIRDILCIAVMSRLKNNVTRFFFHES